MAAAVELQAVSKRFRTGVAGVLALDGIDLAIAAGEFVAIVGPSGAGKSTLLYVAAGLDTADAGEVRVGGVELRGLAPDERAAVRRRTMGFVFQFFHLLPALTVLENVAMPLVLDGHRRPDADAAAIVERLGLAAKLGRFPSELSGGELQRVAVARALVHRPRVLFADEPTGNLDQGTGRQVLDCLVEHVGDLGCTLVLVTHDADAAARADRTIEMLDGRIAS